MRYVAAKINNEEVLFVNTIKDSGNQLAVVTCTVNEHHKVVFEIDTGASCNILLFSDYIRATGDKQGIQISPTRTTLTMHNNSKAVSMGKVMLYVERGGNSHYLCFYHEVLMVKMELDTMVSKEIIIPVTEPTPWVSSMVVTQKKNRKIRICLGPQHLNKAMMRNHYPLPTIEEVATRLTNAKVFSILDAKSGFRQVKLEEVASYLTTFNTPFGRF